jgi:excisionase family DNA binding protein
MPSPTSRRPKRPLTTAEISDRYRVHQRTVIRWIREFGLRATRAGGRWRVEEGDLEEFLTEARFQATGPVYVLVEVDGQRTIGRLLDYTDSPGSSPSGSAPPVTRPDDDGQAHQEDQQRGHGFFPLAAATMSATTS